MKIRKYIDIFKNYILIYLSPLSKGPFFGTIMRFMRRFLLQTLITALGISMPVVVFAVSQLTVEDSVAGLGLSVQVSALPPSAHATLALRNPAGSKTEIPVTADTKGDVTVQVPGTKTQQAGSYVFTVEEDATVVAGPVTATVLPESLDTNMSMIQSWSPRIRADGRDSAEITATLLDKFGNPLPGRPVTLVSSRTDDRITALTPQTDGKGIEHFTLTTRTPGLIVLRAIDLLSGKTVQATAEIEAGTLPALGGDDTQSDTRTSTESYARFFASVDALNPIIDSFEVTTSDTLPIGQEAPKVIIRAIDKAGNTVQGYLGTVEFRSTDPQATLPNFGSYAFKDRDQGQKQFPLVLKFQTPGEQTLLVQDKNDHSITGQKKIQVGGGSAHGAAGIQITNYKDGDYVSTLTITIEGTGPKYANLLVMGGAQDATGSTDQDGKFSIPVTLAATQHEFTIRVRDDAGRNDSGPLHLVLDQVPPTIGTVTFSPEHPEANQKVLIAVQSESKLGQVTLKLPTTGGTSVQSITLAENPTASGSYQAFFTAPVAGAYQPSISAMDKAGNVTEVRTTFAVGAQGLPTVQNVRAQASVNAVTLEWDPLTVEALDGYRIYVGETAQNFLYTLDTGRVTTKATVRGLTPGKTYFFAVTALSKNLESKEKSKPVQSKVLGLTLDVKPGEGSLHVTWSSLSTDLPLSTFILEYGVEPDSYTETRMLNGELRDVTVRDLLNGVTYYLRLTPVTVTGDKLADLSAKGQGTPNGTGFKAGPGDPIPFDATHRPGNTPHAIDQLSNNGIPSALWMSLAAVAFCIGLFLWHRQKMLRQHAAFLRAMEARYHR